MDDNNSPQVHLTAPAPATLTASARLDQAREHASSDERVSLHGVDPSEALRAMLRTPPSRD